MTAYPKTPPIRCQLLRDMAKEAPKCFGCGATNDGTVVGAHQNSLEAQKGMGQKSDDFPIAYVCGWCHGIIDGSIARGGDSEMRSDLWNYAAVKSMKWLYRMGKIKVSK